MKTICRDKDKCFPKSRIRNWRIRKNIVVCNMETVHRSRCKCIFEDKDLLDRFAKILGWQDFNGNGAFENYRHQNIRADAASESGPVYVETRERFSGDT